MNAIEHVKHLAREIGPRGSTTPQEKAAAEYAAAQLEEAGLDPVTETFRSARSAWLPAGLFWSLMLAAGFLFVGGTRLGTLLSLPIAILAMASILLELTFRPNPLRWLLPKGESQNVWARVHASEEIRDRVVLVAHLDTHRTPLAFSSDRWIRWFERLVPIGMAFAGLQLLILAAGIVWPVPWTRYVVIAPMAVSFGMLGLMLQADFTPFSPGANDNATGVGVVLSLAERFARHPLRYTEVWLVLTGCEEVGSYGADAFLHRHRTELNDAAWISVDTVGSGHGAPVFLAQETFLTTVKSDPKLLQIVREFSMGHPELGAHEIRMKGAYTDSAIGAKYGLRVLTLESHPATGGLSDWHRVTDTVDRVSQECLMNTETLLLGILAQMDQDAAAG
jgi:hypothetical protein